MEFCHLIRQLTDDLHFDLPFDDAPYVNSIAARAAPTGRVAINVNGKRVTWPPKRRL